MPGPLEKKTRAISARNDFALRRHELCVGRWAIVEFWVDKGKIRAKGRRAAFSTMEVVSEYSATVQIVPRSFGSLMYVAAQRIVSSIIRTSVWTKRIDKVL